MLLKIRDLPVSQFMTAFPIGVDPDAPFKTVVRFMSSRGIGNLVIFEGKKPTGIFTERELLKHIISKKFDLKTPIKEIGHQSFISINPGMPVLEAARIMIEKKSRLLVFADIDKMVGIITPTDMVRAFRQTDDDPSLENFVSKNIAKCNHHDSIKEAAKIMYDKGAGSVIINDIAHYGILTERDILHLLKEGSNIDDEIDFECSSPLIKAEDTIRAKGASNIMAANNIKRLGITHEKDLVGIITALDLVNAYQNSSGSSHISHWDEIK